MSDIYIPLVGKDSSYGNPTPPGSNRIVIDPLTAD